jgi:hypothetical protein
LLIVEKNSDEEESHSESILKSIQNGRAGCVATNRKRNFECNPPPAEQAMARRAKDGYIKILSSDCTIKIWNEAIILISQLKS